jgi:hypothetical protein
VGDGKLRFLISVHVNLLSGWMYTIWALLMLSGGMLILLVSWKGGRWREQGQAREVENSKNAEANTLGVRHFLK